MIHNAEIETEDGRVEGNQLPESNSTKSLNFIVSTEYWRYLSKICHIGLFSTSPIGYEILASEILESAILPPVISELHLVYDTAFSKINATDVSNQD